ncbi:MAG: hypothetical protein CMJ64_12330 [Planctomycetaceae bacterium]|nr:hypothetical protein [Planctomycetaceae bacterium]
MDQVILRPLCVDAHIEGTQDRAIVLFSSEEAAAVEQRRIDESVIVQFRDTSTLASMLECLRDNGINYVTADPPESKGTGQQVGEPGVHHERVQPHKLGRSKIDNCIAPSAVETAEFVGYSFGPPVPLSLLSSIEVLPNPQAPQISEKSQTVTLPDRGRCLL